MHLIRQELKNGVQLKSVQGNEDTQEAVHQFSSKQKRTIEEDFERIRTSEILKYNATINTSTKGIRYFYYYWKLENINEILSDNRGISVKSPSFALFGDNKTKLYLKHQVFIYIYFFFRNKFSYFTLSSSQVNKICGNSIEMSQ